MGQTYNPDWKRGDLVRVQVMGTGLESKVDPDMEYEGLRGHLTCSPASTLGFPERAWKWEVEFPEHHYLEENPRYFPAQCIVNFDAAERARKQEKLNAAARTPAAKRDYRQWQEQEKASRYMYDIQE